MTKQMTFDPSLLGFKSLGGPKGVGHHGGGGCYIISTKHADGRRSCKLTLDYETSDIVTSMFGDRVGFAYNDEGVIVLYKGDDRKVTRTAGSRANSTISIDSLGDEIESWFGDRRYIDYETSIWNGGTSMLLKPKVDE